MTTLSDLEKQLRSCAAFVHTATVMVAHLKMHQPPGAQAAGEVCADLDKARARLEQVENRVEDQDAELEKKSSRCAELEKEVKDQEHAHSRTHLNLVNTLKELEQANRSIERLNSLVCKQAQELIQQGNQERRDAAIQIKQLESLLAEANKARKDDARSRVELWEKRLHQEREYNYQLTARTATRFAEEKKTLEEALNKAKEDYSKLQAQSFAASDGARTDSISLSAERDKVHILEMQLKESAQQHAEDRRVHAQEINKLTKIKEELCGKLGMCGWELIQLREQLEESGKANNRCQADKRAIRTTVHKLKAIKKPKTKLKTK